MPSTAITKEDRDATLMGKLAAAKIEEKEARRLRREGRDPEAIEAYDRAAELYQESDFAYQRDHELRDEVLRAIGRCRKIVENLRHPKDQRAPATTARPNCLDCGKPLRRFKYEGAFKDGTPREWGDFGDHRFCGLRCGHSWACKHSVRP